MSLNLLCFKKRIGVSLRADCCLRSVPRDDGDLVGQGEKTIVDRSKELADVAAREVGAAYTAGEEGVSGEEEGLCGEVETDAAFGVARGVEDGAGEASDGDEFAVLEGVIWG